MAINKRRLFKKGEKITEEKETYYQSANDILKQVMPFIRKTKYGTDEVVGKIISYLDKSAVDPLRDGDKFKNLVKYKLGKVELVAHQMMKDARSMKVDAPVPSPIPDPDKPDKPQPLLPIS